MADALDAGYWDSRYEAGQTGWDIGYATPQLTRYFDTLTAKDLKILIPGSGLGHEAEYLIQHGFSNAYVLDVSDRALHAFAERVPDFPRDHLIHGDFFSHEGQYDLIVEQTFFCALHPSLRERYVQHMHRLLQPKGRLMGLLFSIPNPRGAGGPPFGGVEGEYRALFSALFDILHMAPAQHSIPPRAGSELFFELAPLH